MDRRFSNISSDLQNKLLFKLYQCHLLVCERASQIQFQHLLLITCFPSWPEFPSMLSVDDCDLSAVHSVPLLVIFLFVAEKKSAERI